MTHNPLQQLGTLRQSVWIDYIRRDFISSGTLQQLIAQDGLRGMTSNPAIFEKAIVESQEYETDIQSMAQSGMQAQAIYETLSQRDVQQAADQFKPVYEATAGLDGYVSLEVNPHLAHDTRGTIEEARRLKAALNRPNVFIKVPATDEGLPAITELISEGININVTLLFGLPRYRQVAQAYCAGLESRLAAGGDISRIASVASFFVSRLDTSIDPQLSRCIRHGGHSAVSASKALGQTAVASAVMAYQMYKEIFMAENFKKLIDKGAHPQRLLWASTGTKNPYYSDVKYVEELIAPDTVNTMPLETLNAYRDHGVPMVRIEHDVAGARTILDSLATLGISIDVVTQELEDEGVEKFKIPFDKIMKALALPPQEKINP